MKKILTHLTGIVFLITILVAGGCAARGAGASDDKKNVKIYCKAFEENGVVHFEMFDSTDTKRVVAKPNKDKLVADHTALVEPGTMVTWRWTKDSEIQKFVRIGPKKPGRIIVGDAKPDNGTNKLKLKIPNNAPSDTTEKYDIEFFDKDSILYIVDPYLRIPDN